MQGSMRCILGCKIGTRIVSLAPDAAKLFAEGACRTPNSYLSAALANDRS